MIVWNEAMKQARKQNAGRDVLELIEEEMPAMENAFMNSANVPDESLELHFECQQCGKKQNICPGIIRIINYKKDSTYTRTRSCANTAEATTSD